MIPVSWKLGCSSRSRNAKISRNRGELDLHMV